MTAVLAASPVLVHRFRAFGGAACELLVFGGDEDAVSQAVADVYAFSARLSRFEADSELSAFNRAAGSGRVAVSPLLEALLRAALAAHELSNGLVNAASLAAVVAAGYDRSIEEVRRRDDAIRRAGQRAWVAWEPVPPVPPLPDVLEVGRGWARLRPHSGIDLGGVGKGWLADRLAERLGDAVVNLGGDLRASGDGPDGGGWRIALCDGSEVDVVAAGVATSGIAGRRWSTGHHLVDPRTGRPARTDAAALSVVAPDALSAETLAKAAAILGCDAGTRFALEAGALRVAVLRDPSAGTVASGPMP